VEAAKRDLFEEIVGEAFEREGSAKEFVGFVGLWGIWKGRRGSLRHSGLF